MSLADSVRLRMTKQIGSGLLVEPNRLTSCILKLRFSNSCFSSSSVMSLAMPFRTTFKVLSSGSLNVWNSMFCSTKHFCKALNWISSMVVTWTFPSVDAFADIWSGLLAELA